MSPKKYLKSLSALTAIVVGCNTTGFKGVPKVQDASTTPARSPDEVEQNRTPSPPLQPPVPSVTTLPVLTPIPTAPPLPPLPPARMVLEMQISQLQPEAWWNNCLKISVGDQTVDMGCTKESGPLKTVLFRLPEDTTCVNLRVQVSTYKNVGTECSVRAKMGLSCEGPYPFVPDVIRSPSVGSQMEFFKVEMFGDKSQIVRVSFEDQAAVNVEAAAADPARAAEFGIDFNDLQFEIKATDVKLGVLGSSIVCRP